MKPIYDGVLRHLIWPPLKRRPHISILHGTIESSEGGVPGALSMRSRSPFTMAFHAILSVYRQKDVPVRAFPMALQSLLKWGLFCWDFLVLGDYILLTSKPDSQSVRHAIMELFHDGVLRYLICPPPKGRPHMSILHGTTESSAGGVIMPGFFSPG
ncbi:hypothetical protein B9Z19DRAFT_1130056 [Tuber borchii]|uniref:Uncharacterized protein n=1 Tax=Tuber borchii TaxID=42251 RepID=A0A2T6ZL71_TUBBO|nr:hypothetical protein B9Z19DRAFT_1130056 [Tuber borchii]